ncbi:N-acetyltransferase [Agrobacterium sp. SOY23]|uniref:GNAT family N-acetyltransferase n=1 Tax=Agrobacterium sp. SOY23 TaxID=3014555 RepID=UPI0022AFE153|nr:N-acetyltransferase [Agrobacterium sp. SOY23]MCZ4428798.1 N-acetyltransferase [Agrobacterium sp. SOY23]
MIVRPERQGDEGAIGALTEAAFRNMPFSDQTEHLIVDRLRKAGALTVSLVAEDGVEIVGHVAFSPVSLPGVEGHWFALGPISVAPDRQGEGIGSRLVREGLSTLDRLEAAGCVLAGDPDYYGRFGFRHFEGLHSRGIPDKYLLALRLHGGTPSGIVGFHPGFDSDNA